MHTSPQNKLGGKAAPLSERLFAIAKSLPKNAVICDVGSDHGALPLHLLTEGKCCRAIVTDLNPLPLARARQNLESAGVSSLAEFILTDGIEAVLPLRPDAFVIAGMGGETIAGILERALDGIPLGAYFVLQPMTKVAILRRFLYEFGFCIENEMVVFENSKFFPILQARFDGICRPEKFAHCFLGEFLPSDRREETKWYFQMLLKRTETKISGKRRACIASAEEENERALLLSVLKEFS